MFLGGALLFCGSLIGIAVTKYAARSCAKMQPLCAHSLKSYHTARCKLLGLVRKLLALRKASRELILHGRHGSILDLTKLLLAFDLPLQKIVFRVLHLTFDELR